MTEAGISASASGGVATIRNTVVRNNAIGIDGHGLPPNTGITRVVVTNSTVVNNGTGALSDSNTGTEVQFTVTQSTFSGNSTAFEVINDLSNASFFLERTTVTFSTTAFLVSSIPGQTIFTAGNNSIGYVGELIGGGGSLTPCCTN